MEYSSVIGAVSIVVNEAKLSVIDDLLGFLQKKSKNNSQISGIFEEFKNSISPKEITQIPVMEIKKIVDVPVIEIKENKNKKDPIKAKKIKLQKGEIKEKVYLKCSFEDKDECKALGAWWDHEKKQWFVPTWLDSQPFKKWFLQQETSQEIVENFFKPKPPVVKKTKTNPKNEYDNSTVDAETMMWFLKFTS